jgi:hypothetical protein
VLDTPLSTEDHLTLVSTFALLFWPIASACIFVLSRTFAQGLIWNVLVGQLLLPVGTTIKFQMVPPINKPTVVSLCCLAAFLLQGKRKKLLSQFGPVEFLLVLSVVSPIITSELNSDSVAMGQRYLPGVGLYDALSAAEGAVIALIPFVLGRSYLASPEMGRKILQALTVAGLAYSIPMLFEVRFSPQLHYWIYGFYSTDFDQAVRLGGFRPVVFMGHGLVTAFFAMTCLIASTALWRVKSGASIVPIQFTVPYLGILLVLCKTLGALIYGLIGTVLIAFFKPKTQFRFATFLVTVSLTYPLLRSFDLVPTSLAVEVATVVSQDRAQSLEFRFKNEDMLLKRALERPIFGWGRYGRSRVYDSETGRDLSTTDGRWIIDIGQFGLLGFLTEFGLLAICVYRAAQAGTRIRISADKVCLAALALIISFNLFDLILNSTLIPWTWLVAGSLLGQAEDPLRSRKIGRDNNSSALKRGFAKSSTIVHPTVGSRPIVSASS